MKIRPILQQLSSSKLFNSVHFFPSIPTVDELELTQLPAVCLYSVTSQGKPEQGGLHPLQQNTEEYSFLIVTEPTGSSEVEDPLDEAIEELRRLIFGLSIGPSYSPFVLGKGEFHSLSSATSAWSQSFINHRTFRS